MYPAPLAGSGARKNENMKRRRAQIMDQIQIYARNSDLPEKEIADAADAVVFRVFIERARRHVPVS